MRRPVSLASALLLTLAAVTACNDKGRDAALPADLAALLPASPALVVTSRGLDAVQAALADLDARSPGDPLLPPDLRAKLDPARMLEAAAPGLAALVDPVRPLALAVVAPPPMAGDMGLTLVVPLRDPGAALPPLPKAFAASVVRGRYLALSTDPAHAARDTVTALAAGLQPGLVSVAVDLAGVVAQYRGMIEMGLGMMAMAPAQDPGAAGDASPPMSPAEARALAGVARGLMDSVRRLDLALDLDGGALRVGGQLGLQPDAPLAPGPQPDFGQAARLTALLPADADMLLASAQDQGREMAFMRDYHLAGLERLAALLPPGQAAAYTAWFHGGLDLVPRLACPAAAALDFGEDGIGLLAVLQPADPGALAAALTDQLGLLGAAGVGLAFVPLEPTDVAGVTVQRWRVEFDDAALAANWGLGAAAAPGSQQAAQTLMVLGDLLPEVGLATVGPLTVLGATDDGTALVDLVARAGRGGGKPDPRVARAAAEAGPDCRQVQVGDLTPLVNWLAGLAAEAAGEPAPPALETPVPFSAVTTSGPGGYGFALGTDVPAIRAAVTAFQAMAALQEP